MAIDLINSNTNTMNEAAVKLMLVASMHGRYCESGYTLRGYAESLIEARVCGLSAGFDIPDGMGDKIEALVESFALASENKAGELGVVIYDDEDLEKSLEPTELARNFNLVLREVAKDLCSEFRVLAGQSEFEDTGIASVNSPTFDSLILIEFDDHKFIAPMSKHHFYGGQDSLPQEYKERILIGYNKHLKAADESHADLDDIYQSINPYVMETLNLICVHESAKPNNK